MNVLIAYSKFSSFVATTYEYLESFQRIPNAKVVYVNVVYEKSVNFDLSKFDVVIISYCARLLLPGYVSEEFKRQYKEFKGVKCILLQDEYDHVDLEVKEILNLEPDIVFTCVPEESFRYVYGPLLDVGIKLVRVLTGYVPSKLPLRAALRSIRRRKVVVGYRGRKISPAYGGLGRLKFEIGPTVKEGCAKHNIPCDIAWTEESRIYGKKWYKWLASIKATLITESGANVFDFDGSIKRQCDEAEKNHKPISPEVLDLIKKRDSEINMAQISPRVFEALSYGCALVGYEGNYSRILEPDIHYLSLKKDHSNLDEVIESIKDDNLLYNLWERAYNDVILSQNYNYQSFINLIHKEILALNKTTESQAAMHLLRYPYSNKPRGTSKIQLYIERIIDDPNLFMVLVIDFLLRHIKKVARILGLTPYYHWCKDRIKE